MDTIENPDFCEALLDQTLKFWMDFHTGFMKAVGDIVDVVMIGDDLAGQNGPLFSTDFYKSTVKPRQKKLVQHIKSMTNAKIWYHTCGGCVPLIPELIDNGVDILNPVQISAGGMDAQGLKDRFGKDLVFWGGGVDTQKTLPFGTPDEVYKEVRHRIEIFNEGGGFVFDAIHNVQANTPVENMLAMLKALTDSA
jgi:uroporphyrinogen decarboxylase